MKALGAGMLWGARAGGALVAAAGASLFAVYAIGQPLWFLSSGLPAASHWAALAWVGPLAGMPMAAMAFCAASLLLHPPVDARGWERLAADSMAAALWGLGLGAVWAGAALAIAWGLRGTMPVGALEPAAATHTLIALAGLGAVVVVNLWRSAHDGAWTALGFIAWGFLGVVAVQTGAHMLLEVAVIDGSRALGLKYNLFVVFYPLLWLAYAATAGALVIFGARWLRFGVRFRERADTHRSADKPPSTANTWPVTYAASSDIKNKAA